ncbi:MAG: O-antigen ligase family protein [Planctomycetota bacterium]|nr:O-antigen ligase family protein [Planctomycetota bacterium]
MQASLEKIHNKENGFLLVAKRLIEADLAAFILLAPLLYGGVSDLFNAIAALNTVVLALACAYLLHVQRSRDPAFLTWCAVALIALGGFMLVPLPASVASVLSPQLTQMRLGAAAVTGASQSFIPLAADPAATVMWTAQFAHYAMLFLAGCLIFSDISVVKRLFGVLMLSAAIQFTYGTIEWAVGGPLFVHMPQKLYAGYPTGSFVSRSHYATFLLAGAGCAFSLTAYAFRSMARANTIRPASFLFPVTAAVLMAGVVLSGSRGAALSLGISVVAAIVFVVLVSLKSKTVVPVMFAAGCSFILVLVIAGDNVIMRYLSLHKAFDGELARTDLWKTGLEMGLSSPLVGIGAGGCKAAFSLFASAGGFELPDRIFVSHLHNDLLESFTVFGAAGIVLIVLFAARHLQVTVGAFSGRSMTPKLLLSGWLLAVLALLLHSFVDFPFAIPAVGGAFAILLAFPVGQRSRQKGRTFSGFTLCAICGVFAFFAFFAALDGLGVKGIHSLYPYRRSDVLLSEASRNLRAGKGDLAARHIRNALANSSLDQYAFNSLASIDECDSPTRIHSLALAVRIAPQSDYIAHNASIIAPELFSAASPSAREELQQTMATLFAHASANTSLKMARILLDQLGSASLCSDIAGEEVDLFVACCRFDDGARYSLTDHLRSLPQRKLSKALELQIVRRRLWKCSRRSHCMTFVREHARTVALHAPKLFKAHVIALVADGDRTSALTLLQEHRDALSPSERFLLKVCALEPRAAAKLVLENASLVRAVPVERRDEVFWASDALYSRGQYAAAIILLEVAEESGLENDWLYARLGRLYWRCGDASSAAKNLEKAMRIVVDRHYYRRMLSECYRELGMVEKLARLTALED